MPTMPGARSLILVRVSAEYCYSCLRLGVETSFNSLDKVISDKSEQQFIWSLCILQHSSIHSTFGTVPDARGCLQ